MFKFGRPEAYWEHSRTSKIELFAKLVNDSQPLHIFAKNSVLDVWLGCEDASVDFPSGYISLEY